MAHTSYVRTIDFGYVPIRKTHTDGQEMALINLSYDDRHPKEVYASIRTDFRTNQPFAVLLDDDLQEVYKNE